MTTLRARFDGKALSLLDPPPDLPRDVELEVDVRSTSEPRVGSPRALLDAVRRPPHVSRETVDEMEKLIAESMRPAEFRGAFDDVAGDTEARG